MHEIPWPGSIASRGGLGRSACIGVFDGLHRGHVRLFEAQRLASSGNRLSVISFRRNPKRILHGDNYLGDLQSWPQRRDGLSSLGFEDCIILPFDEGFRSQSAKAFLEGLVRGFCLERLFVGENSRLGSGGEMDAQGLASCCADMGIACSIVAPLLDAGQPISSRRIRNLVAHGDLDCAARLLGYQYTIDLRKLSLSPGDGLGYFDQDNQVLPPDAEYSVRLSFPHGCVETKARIQKGCISFAPMDINALPVGLTFV